MVSSIQQLKLKFIRMKNRLSVFRKKVQGGILSYVLFLSLALFMALSAILLRGYFDYLLVSRQLINERLTDNLNSAIQIIKYCPEKLNNDTLQITANDCISINTSSWGLLDIVKLQAHYNRFSDSTCLIMGDQIAHDLPALYLADQKKFLSLSHNTHIKGTCYAPKRGVIKGIVDGLGYARDSLVYGEVKQSSQNLPELNHHTKQKINIALSSHVKQNSYQFDPHGDQTLKHPFDQPAMVLNSPSTIYLNKVSIKGKIKIVSIQSIVVAANSNIEGVILVAPRIVIEKGFKGRLQAFAYSELIVEENVELYYPSVLYVGSENAKNSCTIKQHTKVAGLIVLPEKTQRWKKVDLYIDTNAVIEGQIYCNGRVEHKGKLKGSIYAYKFFHRTPQAYYENYIVDGEINREELSPYFVGVDLLSEPETKETIRCIY